MAITLLKWHFAFT